MSNDKDQNVKSLPIDTVENETEVQEKRPNILVRGFRAAKANPKNTIAVIAGTVLVAGAAYMGRTTAPVHLQIVDDGFEPEPLIELPESDDQSA